MKRLIFVVLTMGFFLMGARAFAVDSPSCTCISSKDLKEADFLFEDAESFCVSKSDSGECMSVASHFLNRVVVCERFDITGESITVMSPSEVSNCVGFLNKFCPAIVTDPDTGALSCGAVTGG
jgi:hypothetical protein